MSSFFKDFQRGYRLVAQPQRQAQHETMNNPDIMPALSITD